MTTVVSELKKRLEARDEYVVMANLDTGWFAVNPRTWRSRIEVARSNGREGPNLIVYRTKSNETRDHNVIPYVVASSLLTDDTLRAQVNGSQRWNLTLRDAKLHVTHRPGSVDVCEYFGAPLLVENAVDMEIVAFEAAVSESRKDWGVPRGPTCAGAATPFSLLCRADNISTKSRCCRRSVRTREWSMRTMSSCCPL